jgi:hypothetical protein
MVHKSAKFQIRTNIKQKTGQYINDAQNRAEIVLLRMTKRNRMVRTIGVCLSLPRLIYCQCADLPQLAGA